MTEDINDYRPHRLTSPRLFLRLQEIKKRLDIAAQSDVPTTTIERTDEDHGNIEIKAGDTPSIAKA